MQFLLLFFRVFMFYKIYNFNLENMLSMYNKSLISFKKFEIIYYNVTWSNVECCDSSVLYTISNQNFRYLRIK